MFKILEHIMLQLFFQKLVLWSDFTLVLFKIMKLYHFKNLREIAENKILKDDVCGCHHKNILE